ncbi:MAG: ADP-ribosylation factor-like protein [Candidatus Jordarchaeales archaeon]|nr:gliding-motility protein MglA [Candidatus Jordarchaeia archaeon]
MRRDAQGRLRFKIVLWGPSLSGKTTCLRWIYDEVTGLNKGGFTSVEDPTGRTLYFDYTPISATGKVIFDVFTTAGQRRHKHQRKIVLQGADGIMFVADSSRSQLQSNIESLEELKGLLGNQLGKEIPMLVLLNKRDLPDAMPRQELVSALKVEGFPIYESIAVKGLGVKRAFQAIAREVLLKRMYNV